MLPKIFTLFLIFFKFFDQSILVLIKSNHDQKPLKFDKLLCILSCFFE